MKAAVANHVTGLLRAFGAMGAVRARLAGEGVILMLHEVSDGPPPELSGACPASTLAWMVDWLRREGWEIVSLDEASRRLQDPGPSRQPFAAFTFDDGYKDTLTCAAPVMEQREAPYAVYVPSKAVTRELYPWWLGLRELFRANDAVEIESLGFRADCASPAAKQAALNQVTAAVHQDYGARSALAGTFERYGVSLAELNDRYFMDADELSALARSPLATIGGHAVSHEALATLDETTARAEIVDNRRFLQALLDQPVDHFAYPYGNPRACGAREAELAAAAGYRTAVTTRQATVRSDTDPLFLPRIRAPDVTDANSFDGRVSGLYFALRRPAPVTSRRRAA